MNSIINILEVGLDGAYLRHKALSNNIANVSTPGYKRKDVNFIDTLKKNMDHQKTDFKKLQTSSVQLSKTNKTHLNSNLRDSQKISFKTNKYTDTSYRRDQNNVDIDAEMAKLTKNNLYYNTLSRKISDKFGLLKEVIQRGSE